MTIWNLGSVNADLVYRLPHLPGPGETLAATAHQKGLGGKGANMSVAAVRAGSHVEHIGAIGADGHWMRDRLAEYGVGVAHLAEAGDVSGHAIVAVDEAGQNQIIILPASNLMIDNAVLDAALGAAKPGDLAICQNETNAQVGFAEKARAKGLRMAYAAAPFTVGSVQAILSLVDILVLNEVEARQLENAMEMSLADLPVGDIVVTLGARGCRWIDTNSGKTREIGAPKVDVVDTTGAGDTFTGFLLSALDRGISMDVALKQALAGGALMVTRLGTADVIPTLIEVEAAFSDFLGGQ